MKYLLDTNICIYLIKKQPVEVIEQVRQCEAGDIAVSAITVAELEYRVANSQHQERNASALYQFLLPLLVVTFDAAAAACYGTLRAVLKAKGQPVGPMDQLIAAHALSLNLTLVTNNVREFQRISDLAIANWAEAF